MALHETPRDRFMSFRRTQGAAPRLTRTTVSARGVDFAVFMSPSKPERPPLVCINGGLMYGHKILWPALAPLAARRQLILYDQRGRGESTEPAKPEDARIEDDAEDLGAIRRTLGIGVWDVFGHSWGGGIAALGAERDLDGTRRVVLVDSVGVTSAWMPDVHRAALERLPPAGRARLQRFEATALHDPDPDVQSGYAQALYPAWFADPDLARMFAAPRSTSRTGAAVAARVRSKGYDWTVLLRAVKRPVIVIHGERDLMSVPAARELADTLPDARLEVIPGAGHMPFWEAPVELFRLVTDFLDAPDRSASSPASSA